LNSCDRGTLELVFEQALGHVEEGITSGVRVVGLSAYPVETKKVSSVKPFFGMGRRGGRDFTYTFQSDK